MSKVGTGFYLFIYYYLFYKFSLNPSDDDSVIASYCIVDKKIIHKF